MEQTYCDYSEKMKAIVLRKNIVKTSRKYVLPD
jgi:hypothetical protein